MTLSSYFVLLFHLKETAYNDDSKSETLKYPRLFPWLVAAYFVKVLDILSAENLLFPFFRDLCLDNGRFDCIRVGSSISSTVKTHAGHPCFSHCSFCAGGWNFNSDFIFSLACCKSWRYPVWRYVYGHNRLKSFHRQNTQAWAKSNCNRLFDCSVWGRANSWPTGVRHFIRV